MDMTGLQVSMYCLSAFVQTGISGWPSKDVSDWLGRLDRLWLHTQQVAQAWLVLFFPCTDIIAKTWLHIPGCEGRIDLAVYRPCIGDKAAPGSVARLWQS